MNGPRQAQGHPQGRAWFSGVTSHRHGRSSLFGPVGKRGSFAVGHSATVLREKQWAITGLHERLIEARLDQQRHCDPCAAGAGSGGTHLPDSNGRTSKQGCVVRCPLGRHRLDSRNGRSPGRFPAWPVRQKITYATNILERKKITSLTPSDGGHRAQLAPPDGGRRPFATPPDGAIGRLWTPSLHRQTVTYLEITISLLKCDKGRGWLRGFIPRRPLIARGYVLSPSREDQTPTEEFGND